MEMKLISLLDIQSLLAYKSFFLKQQANMKIVFLHPDLGLGGAEQLIVQLAYGLQLQGHSVVVYTNYFDEKRCFKECEKLEIHKVYDLPKSVFGYGHVFCAWIKFILMSIYVLMVEKCDVFVVDQVSIGNPLLQMKAPVYFYCHFPDLLLTQRHSILKRIYRWPFDTLERWTTNMASTVFVNSNYTKDIYINTFGDRELQVLYPGIQFTKYNGPELWATKAQKNVILSINRFERKKRIDRAIIAYNEANLKESVLLIAGGYDERITENKHYLLELQELCDSVELSYLQLDGKSISKIDLNANVVFLTSFTDTQKQWMLSHSKVLLYTPSNEHFGIVPVEGMAYGLPTIGMKSGGPLETVVHGQSGFLCRDLPTIEIHEMSNFIIEITENKQLWTDMSRFCKKRFESKFSVDTMISKFEDSLDIQ